MTRIDFYTGDFQNCNFINVNLRASDFSGIEFSETKFDDDSNLELVSFSFY